MNNIIRTKETDSNLIKDFYAKGINTIDYINVLKTETINLNKTTTSYLPVYYNFDRILSYPEIEIIIKGLNNSNAVTTEIIGKSVDERNIYSVSVGFGEKNILIDVNIHAAEVASTMFIIKYISDLVNDYENQKEAAINLLNQVKIIVIPSVNPDGYQACLFGFKEIKNHDLHIYKNQKDIDFEYYKANANGVDINRNFPSQHGGLYYEEYQLSESVSSKPSLGDNDYYPGKNLGSEPETKALMYWFNKYLNDSYAYIDMHSAGRVIFSGKPNLSDSYNDSSLKLANIVGDINNYKVYDKDDEDVGLGNDGTATDFFAELASGFKFSNKTGRLSANQYLNPDVEETNIGIITLETLKNYTFDIDKIKEEYLEQKLEQVLTELIKSGL